MIYCAPSCALHRDTHCAVGVLQVASYKKKSDSLAKELKVAIAGGVGATAGADKAKVQELEKKLEVSPF